MIKPLIRDFFTGLTVLVALIALCFMLFRFGELRLQYFQSRTEFQVRLENAGGLKDGSPVTLNGVKVGQISRSEVLKPPLRGAELLLNIDHDISIPRKAVVSIEKSFVGEAALDFATPKSMTIAELSDFIRNGEMIEPPPGAASGVNSALDRLAETSIKIDLLADRLNQLLEPRTLADVAAGKPPNLVSTLARADGAIAAADHWLSDPQLKTDIRELVARTRTTMDDASKLVRQWTTAGDSLVSTVTSASGKIEGTLTKVDAATTDASATIRSAGEAIRKIDTAATGLTGLIENINKGQGTAGQLATNPDLYNSLNDAAKRLDQALADFRDLIEKLKKEGIKIGL